MANTLKLFNTRCASYLCMNMKKVGFHTLGCKLNFSETSTISRQFQQNGYQVVNENEPADIYVINTCSVTDNADKKCKTLVNKVKSHSPEAFIAIIGCYAQLKPKEISEIPGVDAVLGAKEKFNLLHHFRQFEKQQEVKVLASDIEETYHFQPSFSIGDRTRTFLKVQDGCNYNCSFCTIPLARGKSRSSTIEDIIPQAKEIAANGVQEIVLTGVNTGDFGIIDGRRKQRFFDLLKALDNEVEIPRMRISSIEPNLLSNEIIDFVAASEKFVPHFHIPLQSGSDEILKKMHRRYDSRLYAERVRYIKEVMPECAIGVDVIVGFPGETEDHFMETFDFLHQLDVTYLHVFPYSERANTNAVLLDGNVPVKIRTRRAKQLRSLSERKKAAFIRQHIDKTYPVLFEDRTNQGHQVGLTPNYIQVEVPEDEVIPNSIYEIRLIEFNGNAVRGKLTEPAIA